MQNIPLNTQETAPTEIQTSIIESNIITRRNKIQETIKGIEDIEVTSNTTNGITKPKYKFKCQYFCRIINAKTEITKGNISSPVLNITNNNHIEITTNKALKISKCTSKKYASTSTLWESNSQNEETTAETEYIRTTDMEETNPHKNTDNYRSSTNGIRCLSFRNYYGSHP